MISITISGVQRVQSVLSKIEKVNSLVAQWMKSGNPDEIMQKSFAMNFARQGRPDKWAELSEETVRQREYQGYDGGPILQKSGDLMDQITGMKGKISSSMNSSSMTWGIEQLNSEGKKKFGPNQIGKGRSGQSLPSRPMIGFQQADGKKLVNDLRSWILKTL